VPEVVPVEIGVVPADAAPGDEPEGAAATQATVPTRTAPITTAVRIWVERERRSEVAPRSGHSCQGVPAAEPAHGCIRLLFAARTVASS
jgi:hypothetical protein